MFRQKQYVLESTEDKRDLPLSEALTVKKLKNNQLKYYFSSLRVEKNRSNDKSKIPNSAADFFDEKVFKSFLKRYGLKKKVEEKPVMKRMPLKSVKTIHMQIPDECSVSNSLSRIHQTMQMSPRYIEIAKGISKPQIKATSMSGGTKIDINDEDENDDGEPSFRFDEQGIHNEFIEKQLESTQNEILLATTQLEEIKALLAERKSRLAGEEKEEKGDVIKNEKMDKKVYVPKKPQKKSIKEVPKAEWNLKVNPSFARNGRKKLMVTLDGLNARLQRIQDKYFSEPKSNFRTIDQILSNAKKHDEKVKFQDIKAQLEANMTTATTIDQPQKSKQQTKPKEESKLEVILSPKFQKFTESEFNLPENIPWNDEEHKLIENFNLIKKNRNQEIEFNKEVKFEEKIDWNDGINWNDDFKSDPKINENINDDPNLNENSNYKKIPQKGILRNRKCDSTCSTEVNLGAPTIQDSIFKSNFLMREFDVKPNEDFDFKDLKLRKEDYGSAEFIRKNVRFAQSRQSLHSNLSQKDHVKGHAEIQQAIDHALKNSLFYPQM